MAFNHSSGQSLDLDGAQIYFELAGNPSGPPILLLHGGLGSLADFNLIVDRLPSRFKLIGIDLRGHGRSTMGLAPLSYAQYQSDVEAVLEHLDIDAVSVLGFSDGGIVAYRMAARTPSKVRQLVTLGAQWRLAPDDPALPMLSGLTADMWTEMFPGSVAYYEKIQPQPDFSRLVKAAVGVWTDLSAGGYPQERVRHISAPTLLVRGDSDPLFSLSEAVELRDRIDGASFLNIPFAGHAAHEESPDLFVAALNDFLQHPKKRQSDA